MSSGHGDFSTKRRRGSAHSRSRSDRRGDNEKRGKADKKKPKDKKRERAEIDEASSRRKREVRSRSRDDGREGRADSARANGGGGRSSGGARHASPQPAAPPAKEAAREEATLGRTTSRSAIAYLDKDNESRPQSKWREEIANGDPVAILNPAEAPDDEAAVERTLSESRARREALIAKWVNRGETQNGLENPDTQGADESETDGEVSDDNKPVEASAADTEKPTEETLARKKNLMTFILEQKMEHDENDMFDEDADEEALKVRKNQSQAISQTGASADDWDDSAGYYRAQVGEVMGGRYLVVEEKCGQGVFSNVAKAKDQESGGSVAIKIMRCNDMMRQAAEKEVEVLERLNKADRGNKKHVIRLLRHFLYRGHLCLVFECMWDNLRVAVKKYTKDKGMSLHAVRSYTKQLLISLRHIHRLQIIHADIKPDNILISAGHNVVKICDLGSAMDLIEVEVTPYLVSRYYRAPEIVLGMKYGMQLDTFAMGCTLYELFTGKILFPGKTNNDMLKLFMEYKGKIPHKIIKSGEFWKKHFDDNLDFKYFDTNKATRKKITRVVTDCNQKKQIIDQMLTRVGPEKQKSADYGDQLYVKKAKQFADLVEKMTALDPERRITPHDALQHPFVVEAFQPPGAKDAAKKSGGRGAGGGHKK